LRARASAKKFLQVNKKENPDKKPTATQTEVAEKVKARSNIHSPPEFHCVSRPSDFSGKDSYRSIKEHG
jgi:hypothetical protein